MRLFLIAVCFSVSASAQRTAENFTNISEGNSSSSQRDVTDTIVPRSFIAANQGGFGCFTGIYSSIDSGYVSGNNRYGDLEKAQFYGLSQMGYANGGMLQSVLVKFAYKTVNASPENVVAKIYSVDTAQFLPFTLLGTSEGVNLSAISTNGEYTLFIFNPTVAVSDSFFVSVQLPSSAGDTLVLLSTADNCVENSGWAWEKWKNESWHSIENSWVLDIDLAIFPIVDLPYGNGIQKLNNDATISFYPNPATDQLCLQFKKQISSAVSIKIVDLQGKVIMQFSVSPAEANSGLVRVPLQGMESSMYMLEITDSGNQSMLPFCVTKQ